jgi:hypothetical protein
MELLMFLGFLAGLALLAFIGAGVIHWAQLHRAKFEARLKQDMLARGLSVDEIERLMRVSSSPAPGVVTPPPGSMESINPATFNVASAIETMVEQGKETGEIAALLEIFLQRGGELPETGKEPAASAARRAEVQRLSNGLAPALESMVNSGRTKLEIAAFLDTFLPRGVELPETGKAPDLLLPPFGAAVRGSDIQRLGSGRDG